MGARITFLGAAGTVTGSRLLIEAREARVLIDCGLFQGGRVLRERNWRRLPTGPLDAVVLTHAHLDHSGWLPRLVRDGYRGPIHCTQGTADLAAIMLRDAAWLAEEDARRELEHDEDAAPLYTVEDADDAIGLFVEHPFGEAVPVAAGVTVQFTRAGHILGSACLELVVDGTRLVVTGDIGRYGAPLIRDPEPVRHADALVIESTYGDRDHPDEPPTQALTRIVTETVARKGILIIPAFTVGRVQEVLFLLRQLEDEGRVPALETFVDSPMATDVTALLTKHLDQLDDVPARAIKERGGTSPVTPSRTRFLRTTEESRSINTLEGPAIVVSASGMCTGGRIKHHLRRRLDDARNTVCFTGWMAEGTLGRRILEGAEEVRIHGRSVTVRAKIERVNGLSAHADRRELARWLDALQRPPMQTWVVHGEPPASRALAESIAARGWTVTVPEDGQTAVLPDPQ